jgi:hypothetical protein
MDPLNAPFKLVDLAFGSVKFDTLVPNAGEFAPWVGPFQHRQVPFGHTFEDENVCVFITPTNEGSGISGEFNDHHAAVVGVAYHVTKTDFELYARSTDCAKGLSSFNWLAVSSKQLAPPSCTSGGTPPADSRAAGRSPSYGPGAVST